jgi:hypothetical protein
LHSSDHVKRFLWLAIALGGCDFTARDGGGNGADGVDGVDGVDAPTVVRSCKATGPADLRLCIDFEDPSLASLAVDGSGQSHDATATLISPMTRLATSGAEQAAQLGGQSSLRVAETPDLDLASFTIEMWIKPQALLPSEVGLLDNYGQYTMQYDHQGQLRCGLAGTNYVNSDTSVGLGTWHHVACRFDGARREMKVFLDGDVSDCETYATPASTTATAGTVIGARLDQGLPIPIFGHFIGGIDNVRVYSGAIEEPRLCAAAGRSGCDFSCPPSDGSGKGHGHQGGD